MTPISTVLQLGAPIWFSSGAGWVSTPGLRCVAEGGKEALCESQALFTCCCRLRVCICSPSPGEWGKRVGLSALLRPSKWGQEDDGPHHYQSLLLLSVISVSSWEFPAGVEAVTLPLPMLQQQHQPLLPMFRGLSLGQSFRRSLSLQYKRPAVHVSVTTPCCTTSLWGRR